jgi:hypothetical protein
VRGLLIAGLLAAVGLTLFTGLAAGARDKTKAFPVLDAVVGTNDAFEIAVNDAGGKLVTRLAPGTYTVVVHDRSTIHNFHLASNSDSTVDFRTDLDFVGDKEFTVTFLDGNRYVYACEPHFRTMFNSFFVTSAPEVPPPPKARSLSGAVTPGGAVSLASSSVGAGAWRITVNDRSLKANFHLVGPGVNPRTGVAFTGKVTWSVQLRAGAYRYGNDSRTRKRTLRVHA